ncbi:hypothetical protein ACFX14_013253 [Malus domestica]
MPKSFHFGSIFPKSELATKVSKSWKFLFLEVASGTMQDERIGVEHEDPTATALKIPHVAENTMRKTVHVAATSSQHQGKAPSPNPIPIKIKRWFPSMVQVPKQIPDGGRMYVNLRQHNAPINEHHYPLPFKDAMYESAVGSNGA